MNINTIADMVHENAKEKGFHRDATTEHCQKTVANIHGEVSEFWEAYRKGILYIPTDKNITMKSGVKMNNAEEELADIVIRALDTIKRLGFNAEEIILAKHQYNTTRPHMHGKIA